MSFIYRGFHRRNVEPGQEGRVPPGQHVVSDFPVLSAGPTQHTKLENWTFSLRGEIDAPLDWSWDQFQALPRETITKDIHCVTSWTKLDTSWEGVSVDTLLDGVETSGEFVVAFCDGGYTTNLPLEDVTGGKAWIALGYDGAPLAAEHGGEGLEPVGLRRRAARGRARRAGAAARATPVFLEEREVGARAASAATR